MRKLRKSLARSQKRVSVFDRTIRRAIRGSADKVDLSHLYLARAGETFVAAQLLRRGLNAATAPVDSGVDILAHAELDLKVPLLQAEHLVYQFQVKTTATNEYGASLPVAKVHELWHKVINLIVVFWSPRDIPSAIVIPPSLIHMLTTGGFDDPRAPLRLRDGKVSLRFLKRGDEYFVRNRSNSLTAMFNRFELIEPIGTDPCMLPSYASWGEQNEIVRIEIQDSNNEAEQGH
jgi:hypothetical protein